MKRTFLLLIITVFAVIATYSQQLPLFSQYMENEFMLNPALAGAEGYTAFNVTAREQWIGFKQSPKTHSFSAQTRFLKRKYSLFNPLDWFTIKTKSASQRSRSTIYRSKTKGRIGLGGFVYDDRNGLVNRTGMQFCYAYHIFIRGNQLSFGFGASAFQFRLNEKNMVPVDSDMDPLISGRNKMFVPDFTAGFAFTSQSFYGGISATQLMQSALKIGKNQYANYHLLRHYYANAGTNLYINSDLQLAPSVLLKFTERVNVQTDISIAARYMDKYWAGLSYRTDIVNPNKENSWDDVINASSGDVVMFLGIHFDNIFVGYGFDIPVTGIMKSSFGSHELTATYSLGTKTRRDRYREWY